MTETAPAAARRERGLARLIGFTDAVAAIAITLVALPLVDAVIADKPSSVAEWWHKDSFAIIAAAVSFASIAGFWRDHHRLYERVNGYSWLLVRLNFFWLTAIVFLPVATVLLVRSSVDDRSGLGLYIGLLSVTMALLNLQELELVRQGAIDPDVVPSRRELLSRWIPVVLRLLALAVALIVPALGLWPLVLIAAGTPLQRIVAATQR